MGNDKDTARSWRYLTLLSQLAISLLTPCFLMIFICIWLKNRYGLGDWVVLVGLFLGLGSGISSVWVYLKRAIRDAEQQRQEYEDQFK